MLEGPAPPERSVHRHMLGGSAWAIALRWSVRLTGLVSTVVLARLLTPADYGVVAIAMLIVGTIEVFAQTGQYSVIIRHPSPTREHYDSAWTVSLLLGFALGFIVLGAAPLAAIYFHEPRSTTIVEILAENALGLLYRVSRVMSDLGCDVDLVLINTEGRRAIDVFHLTRSGQKLTPSQQEEMTENLQRVLEGRP